MGDHYINIVQEVTEQCGLACVHCFGDYGPHRPPGDLGLLLESAAHYPRSAPYSLELTGGDPFADTELLYELLDHLKGTAQNRRSLCVHSNGLWVRTEKQVRRVIGELKDRGVTSLAFLSNDKYHRAAGLDTARLAMARAVADRYLPGERFVKIGPDLSKVVPIGRARRLVAEEEWDLETRCWVPLTDFETRTELYVRPDGTTGICQNWVLDVTVNMREFPFEELVQRLRSHPQYQAMQRDGVLGLAEYFGIPGEEAVAMRAAMGDCFFCAEIIHARSPQRRR